MKNIILFFIFYSCFLFSDCTQKQISFSDDFYKQANQESNLKKQIELLTKSLESCYAPEIEASLLFIQAENSIDSNKKINFYKEFISVVSEFEDTKKALLFQCKAQEKLYKLFKPINHEVAMVYRKKVREQCPEQIPQNNTFKYSFFGAVILLIIFAFYIAFKKR